MKVLQVGLSYNPGGIESCIMGYYSELLKKGVRFDFVCMYESLAHEDKIKEMGGTIHYMANIKKHPFQFSRQLRELIKKEQYDIVHVNMLSAANMVPLKVAHQMKVRRVIAHSHNSSSPGILRNILHAMNKRRITKYATDYFACSKLAGAWLFPKEIYKRADQVQIIHNAISVDKFSYREDEKAAIVRELQLQDAWVIGHVGRFEEQKNHLFLLEVFQEVARREQDAILLLIGEGERLEAMKDKVSQMHLEERVRFLGVRSDVAQLWKGIDVFLFPSLFEGLPLVVIEAQAAGVFTILSDSITKEVQVTDQLEFVSLHQSAKEWANVLCKYKERQKSEANNAKIREEFEHAGYSIEAAGNILFELYNGEGRYDG